MIRYELVCEQGDRFEGWFRGTEDFDDQSTAGLLSCPFCDSSEIRKALMAPSVRTSKRWGKAQSQPPASGDTSVSAEPGSPPPTGRVAIGADPSLAKAMDMVREISREVRKNADDVGRRFAEEARKIHYREVEPRSIIGEATAAEATELLEEGIEFQPLPILPEDRN